MYLIFNYVIIIIYFSKILKLYSYYKQFEMFYPFAWRRLINKVPRIRCYYLSELLRVGMNQRIITLVKEFWAREVTLEAGLVTVVYQERHTTNWIRITRDSVTIFANGRYRILH